MTSMQSIAPKSKVAIAIFVHRHASPSLVLLLRDIFLAANQWVGEECFEVELIGLTKGVLRFGPVSIDVGRPRRRYHELLLPPASPAGLEEKWEKECRLIRRAHAGKTRISSACLGVFLVAEAGLIDGLAATTHWAWLSYARSKFPGVMWNVKNMICDNGGIVTAGGYLASVDLALYLVAHYRGKKVAHELGRLILAESIRERQSIYATRLISDQAPSAPFQDLLDWIEHNLHQEIAVSEMARRSRMSLRNFQRRFTQAHSVGPKVFLQLKRIEKAKALLSENRFTIDEIVSRVGVNDVSSFRRVFQREVGLTPAEFRRRVR